jgi:hypothetical protein
MDKLCTGENGAEDIFPLDRRIIVSYIKEARENMNKLHSGRPWLWRRLKNEVRRRKI